MQRVNQNALIGEGQKIPWSKDKRTNNGLQSVT